MEVVYRVIDKSTNAVVDAHVWTESDIVELPSQYDPIKHEYLKGTGGSHIGYTYIDGEFIAPPPQTIPYDSELFLPATESADQLTIKILKADVQTLTASLTQVINTINQITRPTSATKK